MAFKPLMPAWRREAETMHLEKGLHGGAAGPAQRAGHPDRECPACHRTAPASRGATRGSRHASDTASGEASDSSWFFGTLRSAAARKPASGRSQRSSSVARASTAGAIPCQWQTKTKTAHVGEIHLRRSGRSSVDVRRAFWAGRRERSDRSPGQHAPRSCAAGGHVATPSRCCSDAARSQC